MGLTAHILLGNEQCAVHVFVFLKEKQKKKSSSGA